MKAPFRAVITLSIRHDTPAIFLNFFRYTPKSHKISPRRESEDLFIDLLLKTQVCQTGKDLERMERRRRVLRRIPAARGRARWRCRCLRAPTRVYILLLLSAPRFGKSQGTDTLANSGVLSLFLLPIHISVSRSIGFICIFVLVYIR